MADPLPQLDLNAIKAPSHLPSDTPDEKYQAEVSDLEKAKSEYLILELKRKARDRGAYTHRLFWLMLCWMAVVLAVVIASGIKTPTNPPQAGIGWLYWLWIFVFAALAFGSIKLLLPKTISSEHANGTIMGFPSNKVRQFVLVSSVLFLLVAATIALAIFTSEVYSGERNSPHGWPLWDWISAFSLSDSVLLGLIGGSTANVIGLFVVVAKHLFPNEDPQ